MNWKFFLKRGFVFFSSCCLQWVRLPNQLLCDKNTKKMILLKRWEEIKGGSLSLSVSRLPTTRTSKLSLNLLLQITQKDRNKNFCQDGGSSSERRRFFYNTHVLTKTILFEICTTTGRFNTHVLTKKFCFRFVRLLVVSTHTCWRKSFVLERDAFVPLAGGRPVSFSVWFCLFLYWRLFPYSKLSTRIRNQL